MLTQKTTILEFLRVWQNSKFKFSDFHLNFVAYTCLSEHSNNHQYLFDGLITLVIHTIYVILSLLFG